MPIVAHNDLPAFQRLRQEGQTVLAPQRARQQDIRELHIGLLNMMPDAALAATERQFFRLIGHSNSIAQFYLHPFTVDRQPRGAAARAHIEQFYEPFEQVREQGLDALIITGANPARPELSDEPFWEPLIEVFDWATEHVTSTLCSCLATHAILEFRHEQKRWRRPAGKRWGVYTHTVEDRVHPLVAAVNTRFDVPHSRFFEVSKAQFEAAGLHVLVESEVAGVHLAVSADRFRVVYCQGHQEYDAVSLLKEYRREISRFCDGERSDYPSFPDNYLRPRQRAILDEYRDRLLAARLKNATAPPPPFPEALIVPQLDNTWHDSGAAIVGNWMGKVYELTHRERRRPFMDGIDPDDPLGLL